MLIQHVSHLHRVNRPKSFFIIAWSGRCFFGAILAADFSRELAAGIRAILF
jgi:hypothetical protein